MYSSIFPEKRKKHFAFGLALHQGNGRVPLEEMSTVQGQSGLEIPLLEFEA